MDFNWLSALTHACVGAACAGLMYYYGKSYAMSHGKAPAPEPLFVECRHCHYNKYPTEVICPHCGYTATDRVVCWVYTGPACQRVFVYKDGNVLRPMVEGTHPDVDPRDAAQHVFQMIHGIDTALDQWRVVGVHENKDMGRTAYLVYIMPSDNGRGGIIIDRVQFPNQIDNAMFRLITRGLKYKEEMQLVIEER